MEQDSGDSAAPTSSRVDPSKLRMSFEKYKKMADLIVLHIRGDEERLGDDFEGVKESAIVEWSVVWREKWV